MRSGDNPNVIGITGASGFLGSYLCDRLPFPQKRLSRQIHPSQTPSFQWYLGDIENIHAINSFLRGISTLIHLACNGYPRGSNQNCPHDVEHNLLPSVQLFEAFARENPKGHVIFSSTGGNMYDASNGNIIHTEDSLPCPQSSYSIHKLAEEHYLRLLCHNYGIRATILRIANPYGILLPKERGQGIIGVALNKILGGEALTVFDSLHSVRDYLHLEDVARAFQLVVEHPPPPSECRLFHVSSGVGYSLEHILTIIEQKTQLSLKKIFKTPLPQPSYSVLSHQKIHANLGWSPGISLEAGINQMIVHLFPHLVEGLNG